MTNATTIKPIRVNNRLRQRVMRKAWKIHRQAAAAHKAGLYSRPACFSRSLKAAWKALRKAVEERAFNLRAKGAAWVQRENEKAARFGVQVRAYSYGRTR